MTQAIMTVSHLLQDALEGLVDLVRQWRRNRARKAMIATTRRELRNLTDSLGTGLLYWGGELVAYKGPQAQDGSPYENQALFSFNGVALPAISALGSND